MHMKKRNIRKGRGDIRRELYKTRVPNVHSMAFISPKTNQQAV